MSLKQLPLASRPREKLLSHGSDALTDAELLAIFLRTGIKGMNALELATYLLQEFGSLRALLAEDKETFCQVKGLGPAKFALLKAVLAMGDRYLEEILKKDSALTNPQNTRQYLVKKLRHKQREAFYILFLDNQHRVITGEILFEGTLDCASVYPREVVKRSLELNAAALILAHNHPSGVAEPSQADHRITRKISDSLALVDIRVLDHFVVGEGDVISFSERGWL